MKPGVISKSIIVLGLSHLLLAQTPARPIHEDLCRSFVQDFYSWYVAHNTNLETALKIKRAVFARELADALAADLAAAAKNPDEIVGLDFDPFVNSQDPARRYRVGNTTMKAGRCWANVYDVPSSAPASKPDVTAELQFQNRRWQFINFHYGSENGPVSENLLSILRRLKRDRDQPRP